MDQKTHKDAKATIGDAESGVSDHGLKSGDIADLRSRYGYNELPEFHESLLTLYLKNFWGPLP
ncbi:MAG: hypothetical protein KGI66_05045, partial [Patescibacteria group bacterium]|nr:hypothetical protein [Patescibacteria group bacterium]